MNTIKLHGTPATPCKQHTLQKIRSDVTSHTNQTRDGQLHFGHLNHQWDKFLVGYEGTQGANPQDFTVKKFDPLREDTAFFLAAAAAI